MKMIALLAVCGIALLTQGTPVTHPLPGDLVEGTWAATSVFIIERKIVIPVGEFEVPPGVDFIVWTTTRRHTDTNAVDVQNDFGTYTYFFDPAEPIEIFDRRPNTPIWYGVAVVITGIAMLGFYFIVKKKRTAGESIPNQYPYPGNSH